MRARIRLTLLAVVGILLLPAVSRAQQVNLGNLPPSTVVGRLGSSQSGPGQAIPFATLLAQLNSITNVVGGPGSSTIGDMALFNNTGGSLLKDSGIAVTGSGTIGLGTAGALSIASGKTLTDTSVPGAVLLLGATGGGFAGYAGSTCASNSVTAISTAGVVTCTARAATNSTKASPAGPNSTSVFTMQGLAGAITPAVSGNIMVTISGTITETGLTTAGNGIQIQLSHGTSTAPTTNAALTGTQDGTVQQYLIPATVTAADVQVPFSITVVLTGLSVGTAYWIDIAAKAISSTGFALSNVNIAASEI